MRSSIISVRTGRQARVCDLTRQCETFLSGAEDGLSGAQDGLLNVFVPHATAGIALLEIGAGSDADLLAALDTLLPRDDRWRHRHGAAGHGRDHVLPSFIAPHATVPVLAGRMQLGIWQSVCLVDTNIDNAEREVRLSFLAG